MSPAVTFLTDNGSLEPAATLRLRELARDLAGRIGAPVVPASMLHSSGVPAGLLGGTPAEILEPAISRRAEAGAREFVVVPLFFGPSRALTDYVPARVEHLVRKWSDLRVRLARPLDAGGDDRLARILADHVQRTGPAQRVALVDHGSPVRGVTDVRDRLAAALAGILGGGVQVSPASMERRPGPEFDFCDPLLETLLERPGWSSGPVTIAMQFLLPGRHAGPDGDVARICHRAEAAHPGLVTRMTPLVGEHPLLVDMLADRWREAAAGQGN